MNSGVVDPSATTGFDIQMGRYFDCNRYGLSVGYMLWNPSNERVLRPAAGGIYRPAMPAWNAIEVDPDGIGPLGLDSVYNLFDGADGYRVSRDMKFQGIEANLSSFGIMGAGRAAYCGGRNTPLLSRLGRGNCKGYGGAGGPFVPNKRGCVQVVTSHGFRWFQVEDDFEFAANINGIGDYQADDMYHNIDIKNNEIVNSCISGFQCFGFGGGAVKINNMTNVTLKGNYVHDNPGHGLHLDQESVNVIYEDNVIRNNEGNGIHHEISDGAIIRNNVIENNGFRADGAKLWGIMVLSSANVEVYGNTLSGNANGIIGRQDNRTSVMKMRNLWVHHNDITLDGSARLGIGLDGISDTSYFTSKNNRFTSNDYTFDYGNNNFKPFKWINGSVNVQGWQNVGMDVNGSFTWL